MLLSYERACEIAEKYYNNIYRFCLSRLFDVQSAHDVTQKVFLTFQEKAETLEDDNILAWLFSVANLKIHEEFKEIARCEKEKIFHLCGAPPNSTAIVYEMEQDNKITDEEIESKKDLILKSLNDKELKLFELFYVKHLEYEKLAEELGISEGAARTRIYRLRLKIKERVSFAFMALILLFMRL